MSELNAYFKSYIAGVSEEVHHQQDISNNLSFDDAMDSINSNRIDESAMGKPFDADSDTEGIETQDVSGQLLDVELLEQHIDKANLSGGNDAMRAIENMAGGGLNESIISEAESVSPVREFESNMLGGSVVDQPAKAGAMSGYSGVTDEIRIKGKRATERSRNEFAYRAEDGRLDMGMLGGSFEDVAEKENDDDVDEVMVDDGIDDIEENAFEEEEDKDDDSRPFDEAEVVDDDQDTGSTSMANEIDLVLNQLRNKTGRTLTGGSINIRKKVVLTDMYPYIIRS
jgi:hypothetical protein